MHYMQRGRAVPENIRRKVVGTLGSIETYISTEASEPELFAIQVAKEVVSKASQSQIDDAVKIVIERMKSSS